MSLKNSSAKTKIPKVLKNKLNITKVNHIYKKFEKFLDLKDNFIVAVSGGPDSLALAFLSKIYSIKNKLKVKYYIIDHKLRTESTAEAKYVKNILKKLHINAEILSWQGTKPKNNIQSSARSKRLELLISRCRNFGITNILLGHHQEDLFENFFIRILRGSGLKGLISFGKKTKINDITVLRPLINQKKEDLIIVSKKVFGFYVTDPTNDDEKFLRVRVRKLLSALKNDGLSQKKFNDTIFNLKKSNDVINYYVNKNLQSNTVYLHKGKQLIISKKFFDQPFEIVFRSLSESINLVGKNYYPSRGRKIDRVIQDIQKKATLKRTLGNCIIEKVNQTVIISKER